MQKVAVVVPNWNGLKEIGKCLNALADRTQPHTTIVVENGSTDGSVEFLEKNYPDIILLKNPRNLGFAGGVNTGIRYALGGNFDYIALLNNDAVPDKDWLERLVAFLDSNPKAGIVTSKIIDEHGQHLDSSGDIYTTWGLPFPRGRGESDIDKYDSETWVFGASGGASLYRAKMLEQIGLFDEDFFAYYEDLDISFRAQLAGWKVGYEPRAITRHKIGATSSRIKGFAAYQTIKNLPMLFWKNVPAVLLPMCFPRFFVAYSAFCLSALARGQIGPAVKGLAMATALLPKKLAQRYVVQKHRKVSAEYISSIMIYDLPPNARKLRALRGVWWTLLRKNNV